MLRFDRPRRHIALLIFGAAALAAMPERSAATLVYDLRVQGGKSAEVQFGVPISLELFVQVTGTNALDDDGYVSGFGSVLSSRGSIPQANSILGDLSPVQIAAYGTRGGGTTTGAAADLDIDTDIDRGSNATSSNTSYIFFNASAPSPILSGEPGLVGFSFINQGLPGAGFEFRIATLTFTLTAMPGAPVGLPQTEVNWRNPTTLGIVAESLWREDGVQRAPTGAGNAGLSVGTPVTLSVVPEPTALSFLLLCGLGAAGLRRRGRGRDSL